MSDNGERKQVQINLDDPVMVANWLVAQAGVLAATAADMRKDKPELEMREVHARHAEGLQALLISQASVIRAMSRRVQAPPLVTPGIRL